MALIAPDGRMLQVNRASCDMLGYSEAALLATSFREITHPADVAHNQALAEAALAGEMSEYELEKRYIRGNGDILWAHLRVSLVRDDDGAPLYFISQIQDITARKELAAEQAATHQRTREVLERVTDGFCALDRDWRFTYINAAAERMGDRPRDELIGKNLWEEFAPARDTPIFAACQRAMQNGVTTSTEFLYPPNNRWIEAHIYPSPEGASIFFRDITDSRRLTEELHASEAKFRTLVEQLPAAVYVLAADDTQTPLYFSPHYEAMTGIRIEQALARSGHWLANVHPKDRARVAAEEARSTLFGLPFLHEYRYLRGDGGAVWVRDVCVPVRDDAGEVVAWQGVLLDITDRIEAEAAQARLAAIVESAKDAIMSSTLDGMITSWNQGAERLYGYTAGEMIGRPFTVLLADDQDDPLRFPPAETGDQVIHFETWRRRRGGAVIDVSVTRSPIFDRTGTLVGVSTITRDITARKRADEALRVALRDAEAGIRAKTLFLAVMSHELRTPLQAILGYADLLLRGPSGSLTPEQTEDLGAIHRGATRMVNLIEQMLDLSRMEAGRLELVAEAVDLADIIAQVRQEVTPQAAGKGLALRVDLPPSLPPARGDALRIHQILLNLAGNAVKFTESGGVEISAQASGEEIAVSVCDTGIGIAPETLPFIFDEFNQVNGNTARRYGGTGLGLAIARRLTEQMGGRIVVESQPGDGSTFTLWLPSASPVAETVAL
jgi:PAS domain S-box-containing protein